MIDKMIRFHALHDSLRYTVPASRRGYAPTAAWDEGNMIQAMAGMKNPTIAWRFGDG